MNAQDSLRERKKARTRASLREHALRLFREQGYPATTVEQIAAAAEVSPSTFFRYFPTKEDVVIQDDMDTRLFAAFDRQPPALGTVAALRASLREVAASFTPEEMEQLREAFDAAGDGAGDPRPDSRRHQPDDAPDDGGAGQADRPRAGRPRRADVRRGRCSGS